MASQLGRGARLCAMANNPKQSDSLIRSWYSRHRRSLIYAIAAMVAIPVVLAVALEVSKFRGIYSACDESTWARIWRATQSSIQARGTTVVGIVFAFLLSVV